MSHSPETLVRMSGQLAHEIEMLTGTARYLREDALAESPDDRLTVRTAVSEAFTVHARTLINFLTEKPKGKAVGGASYVPKWKSELPKSAVKKVPKGKQLVHLTTKRRQGATLDSEWLDEALVAALCGELLRFADAVPAELVEPDFKSRAQVALEAPAEPEAVGGGRGAGDRRSGGRAGRAAGRRGRGRGAGRRGRGRGAGGRG